MTVDGIEERRITRLEYERMIESGIFLRSHRERAIPPRSVSSPMLCAWRFERAGT
jgi:hypothetical protein